MAAGSACRHGRQRPPTANAPCERAEWPIPDRQSWTYVPGEGGRDDDARQAILHATGTETTELDAVLSNIPWGDTFEYAKGIDAVTGSLMPSAIEIATHVEHATTRPSEHVAFVDSEDDLQTAIETEVSGKYNIGGVTAGGSARYLEKIRFSELATSLVASYRSEHEGYDELLTPQLTVQARELMKDPAEFRRRHGDYFVTGAKRASTFRAVYRCQAHTAKDMADFRASFGTEPPDVFHLAGSAALMTSASEHHVSVAIDVWMDGYDGMPPEGPWTADGVVAALDWFKAHEEAGRSRAELAHYSTIDPSFPRTVGVAPDVFIALKKLYTTVWAVRAHHGSCPSTYRGAFSTDVEDLVDGVTADQDLLATDPVLLDTYQSRADELRASLHDVLDRMDFYFQVVSAVPTEPACGTRIDDSTTELYHYGFATYTKSAAVTINTDILHFNQKHTVGLREHTFEWQHDDRIIVGWELLSNWHNSLNGSWTKTSDQILLRHHAQVHVESCYERGCDWTLQIHWVDAEDFDFATTT